MGSPARMGFLVTFLGHPVTSGFSADLRKILLEDLKQKPSHVETVVNDDG